MSQSKFSLADLLTLLGSLGFGFFCFLSINFLTLGDTFTSLIQASVITLTVGGLAFGLRLLKRSGGSFRTCIILEFVLCVLFLLSAYAATFPFSHYFSVYVQKGDIQQKILLNVEQAEGLYADYDGYVDTREFLYKEDLKAIVGAEDPNPGPYIECGFVSGINGSNQINHKVFILSTKLKPSNYSSINEANLNWLNESKGYVTNWSPLGIVEVVNTLGMEISSWKAQLISFSIFRAQCEAEGTPDFEPRLTLDTVSNGFSVLKSPKPLSLVLAIGFYVIMLLSYFVSKRDSKYPGLKVIFGTVGVKDNEL